MEIKCETEDIQDVMTEIRNILQIALIRLLFLKQRED